MQNTIKIGDTVQIGEAVVQVQFEVSKRHGRTQHSAIPGIGCTANNDYK